MLAYILQSKTANIGGKIGLGFLGVLGGFVLMPFFAVAAVFYTIYWLGTKAVNWCECCYI